MFGMCISTTLIQRRFPVEFKGVRLKFLGFDVSGAQIQGLGIQGLELWVGSALGL